MKNLRFNILSIVLFVSVNISAQNIALIYGKITDSIGKPVEYTNISVEGMSGGVATGIDGSYKFNVPAGKEIVVVISRIGYKTEKFRITLSANEKRLINKTVSMQSKELPPIEIIDSYYRESNLIRINPKTATIIPSVSGGIEAIIKTMPGVYSNNELSSQYSVRGGNYDENLVYVNDVEIYRPFLVHSAQQEGLSFLNSDLVSSVLFSSGGFDAKYGDKMSSVLDIQYKKPVEFAGSASVSLLGASAHVEDASVDGRLSYILGIRHKTNKYVLNSLDTKGDYRPSYTDMQTCINYKLSKKVDMMFLGNYSRNLYRVTPQTRETVFGTISEALRFKIYFDGQEMDKYETYMSAS